MPNFEDEINDVKLALSIPPLITVNHEATISAYSTTTTFHIPEHKHCRPLLPKAAF